MHRLVIALVTLIALTGAAFVAAFLLLLGASTDRAASLAPSSTAAYVNVYLQPSAGQQMNLADLIGRLPGFADDASLDEKIDQVVQNLLGGTGIDYRGDLKPWLGNQVALAAWPGETDLADGGMVLIAEVKDPDAALDAIPELLGAEPDAFEAESHAGVELLVADAGAYALLGEMLVVAPDAASLRAAIDAERGSSLAERSEFRSTMEGLPGDHLAAAFIDLAAFGEAATGGEQLTGLSTAGAVLVAEPEGLRVSGSAPFDMDGAAPSARAGFALGTEPSSLVDWMPESTVAEVVIFGLRQSLEDAEGMLRSAPEGQEVAGFLDTARALAAFGLGINLDTDVLPLFDREVAVAISGFDGELPSGQLLLRPSDGEGAAATLDRLAGQLEGVGATRRTETAGDLEVTVLTLPDTIEVAYAVVDRIIIMGLSPEDVAAAVQAHASGDTLHASEPYRTTFEVAGARAGTEAYLDVGALVEAFGLEDELPDDARDILLQIGSFGFTAPSRDDQIEFHAVLTVERRRAE